MLKLRSKGGKLDIVLSDGSLLKDTGIPEKSSIRSINSAGRRKTKEQKSDLFPKKKNVSPRRAATKLNTKSTEVSKPTDQSSDIQQYIKPGPKPQKSVRKDIATRESQTKRTTSKEKQTKPIKEVNGQRKVDAERINSKGIDAGVIGQDQLQNLLQTLQTLDPSVLASMGLATTAVKHNGGSGDAVKTDQIGQRASPRMNLVEPDFIPGLTHATQSEETPYQMKYSPYTPSFDSISETSKRELQKPSLMSVGGTPVLDYTTRPSPASKPQPRAMQSSFALGAPGLVAFDPAQENRNKQQQWLAELENQMHETQTRKHNKQEYGVDENPWMESQHPQSYQGQQQQERQHPQSYQGQQQQERQHPQSYQGQQQQERQHPQSYQGQQQQERQHPQSYQGQQQQERQHPQSYQGQQQQMNMLSASSHQTTIPPNNANNTKSFARGNALEDPFVLEQRERERHKLLEHQRAIQEQVEEKRRKRQEERERKYQEQQQEEQRLADERAKLARQYQEELRAKEKKEEAERKRHEALQKSVLEAYEASQAAKQEERVRRLKLGGHDVSRFKGTQEDSLPQSDDNQWQSRENEEMKRSFDNQSGFSHDTEQYGHITSRSIKESRPILSLIDDSKALHDSDTRKQNSNRKNQNVKENVTSKIPRKKHVSENTGGEDGGSVRSKGKTRQSSIEKNTHSKNMRTSTESIKDKSIANDPKTKSVRKITKENIDHKSQIKHKEHLTQKSLTESDLPHTLPVSDETEANSYMAPVQRSTTITLRSPGGESSFEDKISAFLQQDAPTARQQQILDQLQDLRRGLMDKMKEYERGTTPQIDGRLYSTKLSP